VPPTGYGPRPVTTANPLRAEIGALVRLAIPLSVSAGGQALMGLVDTAIVGRSGVTSLAGVGLGAALFFAVAVFGMGLMHGIDPLVSQALGSGDPERARRFLWQGIWLATVTAAATAAIVAFAPLALVPLGIAPEVAREASRYLWWRLPGLPFFLFYFVARAYLQAHHVARPMVIAVVTANVLNLGADLLFVFGGGGLPAWAGPLRMVPAMGASGAAVATSLCTAVQAAILALAVTRIPAPRVPGLRRAHAADLRAAAAVGAPIALHMTAEVGIFALGAFLAGRMGPDAMAAHQLALAVASVTFTFAIGFGEAGSVRVGRAVGGKDRLGARRAGVAAFSCGATFMTCSALVFVLFPAPIARLFTDDPEVVRAAAPLLRIAALFQISDGVQGVGAGVLRGAGETRFTFVANMVGHWLVGLPAMILFGFTLGWGVAGVWVGFVFGLTTVAISLLLRFRRISSREIVPLAERALA
jgi:multidrug resistance protein, MATE family